MDFSLHEQRTLARIEQELSDDRRLSALMTILESEKPRRWRRLRAFGCRLRHPRQEGPGTGPLVFDTRPLLAVTILFTVATIAVLVTSIVLGIGTLIIVAAAVLPLLPTLRLIASLRLRRGGRARWRAWASNVEIVARASTQLWWHPATGARDSEERRR